MDHSPHVPTEKRVPRQRKKRLLMLVAALSATLILLSGVLLCSGFLGKTAIRSAKDAERYFSTKGRLSELNDKKYKYVFSNEGTVGDIHHYRFDETYDGYRVYGAAAVLSADKAGNIVYTAESTSAVEPVNPAPDDRDIDPELFAYLETWYEERRPSGKGSFLELSTKEPYFVIYIREDGSSLYAVEGDVVFTYLGETGRVKDIYRMVLRADVPEVLYYENALQNDRDVSGTINGYPVDYTYSKGQYMLTDASRNMTGYQAKLQRGDFFTRVWDFRDSKDRCPVTWTGRFPDDASNTVAAYSNAQQVHTYFTHLTGGSGINREGYTISVITDFRKVYDSFDHTTSDYIHNAFHLTSGSEIILAFADNETATALDVVAHEYAHAVERSISGMHYSLESGALMEAFSDIFGDLAESYLSGKEPDWVHGQSRDLRDPGNKRAPSAVGGAYWMDPADIDKFTEQADRDRYNSTLMHTDCTVISHAMYLMNTGCGGTQAALSPEELAVLLYNTMWNITDRDCSFSDFRAVTESVAKYAGLSEEQQRSVSAAFGDVGVTLPGSVPDVTPKIVLTPDPAVTPGPAAAPGYVYTAIEKSGIKTVRHDAGWGEQADTFEYHYRVPQFTIDSETARKANEEIMTVFERYRDGFTEDGLMMELRGVDWSVGETANTVSVEVYFNIQCPESGYDEYRQWYVYNIDKKTGESVPNGKLMADIGINADYIYGCLVDRIESLGRYLWEQNNSLAEWGDRAAWNDAWGDAFLAMETVNRESDLFRQHFFYDTDGLVWVTLWFDNGSSHGLTLRTAINATDLKHFY